jgi:hypothetical protein
MDSGLIFLPYQNNTLINRNIPKFRDIFKDIVAEIISQVIDMRLIALKRIDIIAETVFS